MKVSTPGSSPPITTAPAERREIAVLTSVLEDKGFEVFASDSDIRPTLVAYQAKVGLLALDLVEGATGARANLNRKIAGLRDDVPVLARTKIHRRIVDLDSEGAADGDLLTFDKSVAGYWLDELSRGDIDDKIVNHLRQVLVPRVVVPFLSRQVPSDPGVATRGAVRLRLDVQQSRAAQHPVRDVLVVTGPPGSGKTLVLIARARWLAERYPNWHIQVLCYNRALVPYLQGMVSDLPTVRVSTFGKFAHAAGYSVSLTNEDVAFRQVEAQLPNARPFVSAVLIDEWQDFMPAWISLALALTVPGRGGVALAGDPQQALYRDARLAELLNDRDVTTVELKIPYRCTRQILDVTAVLDPAFAVSASDRALEGEPVDLVWAHSMTEQAAAVARDIRLILEAGERTAGDVAVLVTRKWDIGRVVAALTESDIPCRVIYPSQADVSSLSESAVKIMTVHSAKGYEFPIVFLVGLEHPPNPDGSVRAIQGGRSGYVAFTRAKDQLVVTYTRDNTYLDRIQAMSGETLRTWVWPDDYAGTGYGDS